MDKLLRKRESGDVFIMIGAIAILLASFFLDINHNHVFISSLEGFPLPPLCIFHTMTGMDCPSCGLTRSFISISKFELGASLSYNAAGMVVYPYVLFQILYRGLKIANGHSKGLLLFIKINRNLTILMIVGLVLGWIYKVALKF